ncbi:MAG TPA: glycosyltransferase family 1 protein [Chloroflexi bacterium]|nr:MAG: glycosyltransferase family 1 protein [Chloroflexota bacterium]HDN04507.1 glycosyltransferase family 1 protein [Chloroflexota bacterium]
MRIAVLSYHTCPLATLGGKDAGGMNVYVRDLALYLGREGIELDVFTRSQDEHVPHVLHDLGYGNRVVHIPAGPEYPIPKKQLAEYIPEFGDRIHEFSNAKNLGYDLIHSHYWMSGLAAEKLSAAWNVPVIQMFHTLGKLKQAVAQNMEEAEGDYRIAGETRVIEISDKVVASTSTEKDQLETLYNAPARKIEIIPPGVDLSHFYPIPQDEAKEYVGAPLEKRMLLFVGRIEPLKGIKTLLRAIGILRANGQAEENLCLAVIGGELADKNGQETEEVKLLMKLRDEYGLQDMVTFLGKRSQDSLPYYYSAAEMVIMPSHYESFGMVALESMACGTPVIASLVGGLIHLVEDGVTGYHVPVEDPRALSLRIASLLRDEALRYRMGRDAFAFAKKYSWDHISHRMIKLYSGLLEGKLLPN